MEHPLSRRSWIVAGLGAVALAGAADVGLFIVTQPAVALKDGGRAGGSIGGLVVWLVLASLAGARWSGREGPYLSRGTLMLAALAAAGGVGLAAVHMAAHVGGWRSTAGGVLGVAALALAIAANGRRPG
jgi:hypothetical protein